MSTLQELVRYCNEERHLGALLLTGEWGCGKTYLIEKELAEALSSTHFIVRVSLFGVDSIGTLNDSVRKQWLFICTPFLGKLNQRRDQMKKNSGFISAISSVLSSLNPVAGNVASAVVSFDPMEYIPLESEVEDFRGGGKKKVVLVFDDLDRCKLDWIEVVGNINEYCENKGFKTIIVANEAVLRASPKVDLAVYRVMKEKTITRTVLYIPKFQEIIHHIIDQGSWPSPEYAEFLAENEQMIHDVFASDPPKREDRTGKFHNIRSLSCALNEFYRIYEILTEDQAPDINRYLYSYITYMLISKSGIYKNGEICFDVGEEEIRQLYPGYSADTMPESIRQWIEYGIWEKDTISRDICNRIE